MISLQRRFPKVTTLCFLKNHWRILKGEEWDSYIDDPFDPMDADASKVEQVVHGGDDESKEDAYDLTGNQDSDHIVNKDIGHGVAEQVFEPEAQAKVQDRPQVPMHLKMWEYLQGCPSELQGIRQMSIFLFLW